MNKYFEKNCNTDHFSSLESKELPVQIIKSLSTSNNSLAPELSCFINKIKVKFNGSCLKQSKITYIHAAIVNMYIVYKLSSNLNNFDLVLENCLLGAVKLTKMLILISTNIHDMVLDLMHVEVFFFPSSGQSENVIIFGADTSSSVHTNNEKKDLLILGKGITQGFSNIIEHYLQRKSIQLILLQAKRNFV